MCCVCVRVWVRVQVCGCVCVCTCASLPRTLEPSTLNVPRARGPCQPRHPAAEQPEGQGPTPSIHLPIQPILCNKRQQLTELRMTPALLLRHCPSLPCLPLPCARPWEPEHWAQPQLGLRDAALSFEELPPLPGKPQGEKPLPAAFSSLQQQPGRSWVQADCEPVVIGQSQELGQTQLQLRGDNHLQHQPCGQKGWEATVQ